MALVGSVTETRTSEGPYNAAMRIELHWTSHTDGTVSDYFFEASGMLVNVAFVPDASAAPTDNYDVTLLDDYGIDVLSGRGSNHDTAAGDRIVPAVTMHDGTTASVGPVLLRDSTMELNIANAGSAKRGYVVLYLKRP